MTQKQIIDVIVKEIKRAEKKHPNWPKDKIYASAIVCEESGELIRAAVQYEMDNGREYEVFKEAIHTAATCIRLLKNL